MGKTIKFEIIGHILIIRDNDNMETITEFARKKMREYPSIKTVALQRTKVSGWQRVRDLEYLFGAKNFETIYKEHGCVFKLNPKEVFFTERLSGERLRLSKIVSKDEIVLNCFAGVGPFSILIAKYNPSTIVHSIELNPKAYHYLVQNIILNKCENRVFAYLADAFEIVPKLFRNAVDRVLLPLPAVADNALILGIRALKTNGGFVHWQTTERVNKNVDINYVIEKRVNHIFNNSCRNISYKIHRIRFIRSLAPRIGHFAVDIEVFRC